MEKASIGMYLSGHPMEEYSGVAEKISNGINIGKILSAGETDEEGNQNESEVHDGDRVVIAGIITARKDKTTKNNKRMTFLRLEDLYGGIEVLVFPKVYDNLSPILQEEAIIVATCNVSIRDEEESKLLLENAVPIADYVSLPNTKRTETKLAEGQKLFIKMGTQNKTVTEKTMKILEKYSGSVPVILYIEDKKRRLVVPEKCFVTPSDGLFEELYPFFGEDNVKLC